MRTGVPFFGWEQLPAHMLAFFVSFGHQRFHEIVFLDPLLLAQPGDHGTVVILGAVVHLVVHAGLLGFQHLLGIAHGVNQLRNREFGHLLQRVEEVHHCQVLLGGHVQLVHVGHGTVGGGVVIGIALFQLLAEFGQLLEQDTLHQWKQGAYFRVGQVILAVFLFLKQVVEKHTLVDLVMATCQELAEQRLKLFHPFAFEFFETPALQVDLQHFLLLADHVVVVQNPFVGASHEALRLGFLYK